MQSRYWLAAIATVATISLSPLQAQDAAPASASPPVAGEAVIGDKGTSVIGPRIIGGSKAEAGSAPGIVALVRVGDAYQSVFQRQYCAGTLLSDTWVLTAAHCVTFDGSAETLDPSAITVVGEAIDLDDPTLHETPVSGFYVYPDYKGNERFYHDIALIELAEPIGGPVAPLLGSSREAQIGKNIKVSGWGVVHIDGSGNEFYDSELNEVEVPLISNDVCNAPISYAGTVSDNQFCAGFAAGGADSCQGDSGGPAYVYDGELKQLGIVSSGNGCAEAEHYGIYTDVTRYYGWIDDYVPKAVPAEADALEPAPSPNGHEVIATSDDDDAFIGAAGWLSVLLLIAGCRRLGRYAARIRRVMSQADGRSGTRSCTRITDLP